MTFSLLNAPQGMTVEANTGVLSWTPNGLQLGTYEVKLVVADTKGGTAQQTFKVQTQAQPGNHAPIITSDPITQFGITSTTNGAQTTTISTIVRDFRMWGTPDGHPDFERFLTNYPGMVSNILGDDSTPVFIASNNYGATNASTFYQWYHDTTNVNQRVDVPITLTETAPGSEIWQYSNSSFFPIDNKGFGNQGYGHNFAFTLESHVNFTYKGGEVFNFNGDDDVWVFINNKLAIDLGGAHPPQSASVNLDTLGLTRGQTYNLDLFFAERHTDGSSLQIQTSLDFGSQYVYKLNVADADNDSLKYELVQAPTGMLISADGTLSWRPKLSQQGIYPITVKVTDARGGVAIQSFNLKVTPSNPGEIHGTVYRDANGDATKISTEAGLQNRIVYIDENSNGKRDSDEISNITDANGNYAFTKLASGAYNIAIESQTGWNLTGGTGAVILGDGQILNNINIGTIEAKDPSLNQNPYFVSTPTTTVVEAGKVFRYQAKAQDPDGDGLAYSIVVGNQRGISVDSSTGVVAWQPTTPFIGSTVDVLLRAADPYGGVVLQPFQIQVVASNTAPVFTNFPANQLEATVNYPIQYQFKAQDAQGDPITYSLDTSAPNGATLNPITGILFWKPTTVGNSTFNIIVTDNKGATTSQSITIGVTASTINANPFISSQPPKNIALGQTYLYTVQANDPNYDPLTYTLNNAPVGMTIDPQGRITWQPQPNQIGSNPITLKVDDGRGGVITQAFNIDVVSTAYRANNAPSITSTPNLVTNLERTYAYNLSGNDSDSDLLMWSLDSSPAGMVIDPQSGALRWQPKADQIGEHTVTVRLTDVYGLYAAQEFTLHVTGVNTPSAIVSNPITKAAQNQFYTYNVVATDPENDPLTFSLGRKPAGMTIDSNGTIQWTPQSNQIGSQIVEVFARDAQGAVTTQTYTIEVGATAINTAPSITSTPVYLAAVGSPYSYQVQATDSDAGDRLTYQLLSVPAGVTGISIDSTTGLLTWANPVAGNYKIVVGAVDAAGLGAAQGFTLTARVNNAPVIRSTPVLTATPGSTYSYDIIASDADGDRLTYTLDQASRDLGMTLDALGRLRWTPTAGNVGSHTVVLTVTDGNGGTQQQQYNLSVAADMEAPKVRLIANYDLVNLGESITFQARATDNIKVAGLQLLIDGTAVVLDSNGMATFKPTTAGTITAKAIAKDAAGNIGEATFSVAVIDTSDVNAPEVSLDLSAIAGGLITAPVDIKGSISDDGSLDYYRLLVAPVAGGDFKEIAFVDNPTAIADGVLGKFDPSLLQNDSYILRLEVADNGGHISYVDEVIDVAGELKLGNFRLSFTDLTVPVTGIPITLTRTYDSLNSGSTDDFGYGWRMEFRDTDLRTSVGKPTGEVAELGGQNPFEDGTKVYITLPGGKREGFTFKPTIDPLSQYLRGAGGVDSDPNLYHPSFVADAGVTDTLTVQNTRIIHSAGTNQYYGLGGSAYNPADTYYGGIYTLTTKEGIVYEIDAATGDLLTVTDTNGNTLTYTDADITSSTGQKITFGRDAQGRIATVTDPAGKQIRYEYDAKGDLISVTDREGNTTQMEYDQERKHYLDKIIDPLGKTGVRNEYADDGRLKKMVDAAGASVQLAYDPSHSTETITDALGHPTTYEYDERGNVVTEIDALGGIITRSYDKDNNLLKKVDPDGVSTTYTYDSKGNPLTITDQNGNVTRITYNQYGETLNIISPRGLTVSSTYDKHGNLLSRTNTDGQTTTFSYDGFGRLIKQTAPDNEVSTYTYDGFGNPTVFTDSRGNQAIATYDLNGKVKTLSMVFPQENQTLNTSYTYDNQGRTTSVTNPQGNVTTTEYDAKGNVIATTDIKHNRTQYFYDDKGQQVKVILPDNTPNNPDDNPVVLTEYDAAGRVISQTSATGLKTRYVYDELGRLTDTILPDLTPDNPDDNLREKIEYTAADRIQAKIDIFGTRTEYTYDNLGRVSRERDFFGNSTGNDTTYTYNTDGQVTSVTDARNRTTLIGIDDKGRPSVTTYFDGTTSKVTYDALGRTKSETNQLGQTTSYDYDVFGKVAAITNPLNQQTQFTYNSRGSLVKVTDALNHSTGYEYDQYNRKTAVINANGDRIETTYNQYGQVAAVKDGNQHTTQYFYDNLGELTSVKLANQATTNYTYDNLGRLTQFEDANHNKTTYEFDAFNRQVATNLPLGQRSTSTFNNFGQVANTKDFNDDVITYAYDQYGRLANKSFSNPLVATVSYTYDPVTSQVKTVTDGRGVTSYGFDSYDRVNLISNPDGQTVGYTYDVLGNLKTLTSSGSTVNYSYDLLNRLDTVTSGGQLAKYGYDAVGNLISTALADGTTQTQQYDASNRLKSIETRDGLGGVLSRACLYP